MNTHEEFMKFNYETDAADYTHANEYNPKCFDNI